MVVGVVEWVKSRLFSSENIEEKYDAEKSSESESETPESCVTESSALPEEKYNAEQSSKSESDSLENFVNCSIVTITESKVLPEEENLLEMDTELTGNSGKKEKPLVDQASCSHHKGDVMKSGSKQSAPPENKPATPAEKKSSAADASVKSYVDKNFTKEDSDSEDLDPRNPDSVEDLLKVTQNNVSDIPLLDSNFWTWTPEILKQFLASAGTLRFFYCIDRLGTLLIDSQSQ